MLYRKAIAVFCLLFATNLVIAETSERHKMTIME